MLMLLVLEEEEGEVMLTLSLTLEGEERRSYNSITPASAPATSGSYETARRNA